MWLVTSMVVALVAVMAKCAGHAFHCDNKYECTNITGLCNLFYDCSDGSDEQHCRTFPFISLSPLSLSLLSVHSTAFLSSLVGGCGWQWKCWNCRKTKWNVGKCLIGLNFTIWAYWKKTPVDDHVFLSADAIMVFIHASAAWIKEALTEFLRCFCLSACQYWYQ